MTEIDPRVLTAADWNQVSAALGFVWLFWLSVVSSALFLLTAHAVIPSLQTTGHIGPSVTRTRPVFYAVGIVAALVAVFAIIGFVDESEVLRSLYPRVWI